MKDQGNVMTAPARQRGVVSTEFAILLPVFFAIIVGIVEFGHLWYRQHMVTNASREGARTATTWTTIPGTTTRICGSAVQNVAEQTVNDYFRRFWPSALDPFWTVEAHSPGQSTVTDCSHGSDLVVRVTASNNMLVLDKLITAFESISREAQTTMKFE